MDSSPETRAPAWVRTTLQSESKNRILTLLLSFTTCECFISSQIRKLCNNLKKQNNLNLDQSILFILQLHGELKVKNAGHFTEIDSASALYSLQHYNCGCHNVINQAKMFHIKCLFQYK